MIIKSICRWSVDKLKVLGVSSIIEATMKFLSSFLLLLATTSLVQGQGAEYSEYGDYQDYQEYADDYGQQDSLYADYAQRQQIKAAGGGG